MHMHDMRIFKSRLITIVVALVVISQYHSQSCLNQNIKK